MTPMPIHYGKSHKVGVNINFELSVTQVNLAINALYILYAHKLSWVTTTFAISSLRSLPSKLFNSLPKKKRKNTQMGVLKATSSINWEQESYPMPKDLVLVPLFALFFLSLRLFLDRYVFEVKFFTSFCLYA